MKRKRDGFIEELFEQVCNAPNNVGFRTHVFHVLASLGLQQDIKKEGLFQNVDWSNPKSRGYFLEKVHCFLQKHIK
jgi:hypothetical protein